jgi:hypothetical protein
LTGHSRTSSRQCLKHKKPTDTQVLVPEEQDPDDSEEDAAKDVAQYETLEAHLQRHAAEDAATTDDGSARNNSNGNDEDSEVQELHVL